MFEFSPAPPAPIEDIERVHDADYVRAFLEGVLEPQAMRRIGFPWSRELVARTLASAGGTLAATEQALLHGWGGTLGGGTHHAFRGYGSGYCVFNDIAIAIRKLFADGRACTAAVIDLDVHQGDGTAEIFSGDDRVFTLSIHGRNNFPFRKQKSVLDIELADGTGDEEYLVHLARGLAEAFEQKPDIVFYQSGVDSLATDRLGKLALTLEGLAARDRAVFGECVRLGVPYVVTLGGGYSEPIERTVEANAQTYLLAAEFALPCWALPAKLVK
ncbi:MAG: histone deacetylase [Bryobacteraceae bacterium]